MTITFTLPLVGNKPTTSKDMVLTILTEKHPLSLIELQHAIHKQYGRLVSFQSVRQAVLELEAAHVLTRHEKRFAISTAWIQELILFGNKLQSKYLTSNPKDTLVVGPNVTVYTVTHMAEADAIWNRLIREIFADPSQPRVQTFTGSHFWFVLVTLAQETALVKHLTDTGVSSHFLCYGNTPIDEWSVRYYQDIGIDCKLAPKPSEFILGQDVGSYGDYIIQVKYPAEVSNALEDFYKRHTRVEDAKLADIAAISAQQGTFQLTVIHDALLARNFRENVLQQFDRKAVVRPRK